MKLKILENYIVIENIGDINDADWGIIQELKPTIIVRV